MKDFLEEVKNRVLETLKERGLELTAEIVEVTKNNGLLRHGLTFRGERNIQPMIYLDRFFKDYAANELTMDEVVEKVAEIYADNKFEQDCDMSEVLNYEAVRDKIICCVQNRDANCMTLKEMPYTEMEDLAIYYRIALSKAEDKDFVSIIVKNELLDRWGVSVEELHRTAWENTRRLFPPTLQGIGEVLAEIMEVPEVDAENGAPVLYVLSNKNRINGAVYMADYEELQKAADTLDDDLIILPSSIHEILLLRASDVRNVEDLREMVREINRTQVSLEERLSGSVYRFTRKTESGLRICA